MQATVHKCHYYEKAIHSGVILREPQSGESKDLRILFSAVVKSVRRSFDCASAMLRSG